MQDSTRGSRSSRQCPSCNKSLDYSPIRCAECGWQRWNTRPEFLWLMVALVIGGVFVVGLYFQGSDYTTTTQRAGERQSH